MAVKSAWESGETKPSPNILPNVDRGSGALWRSELVHVSVLTALGVYKLRASKYAICDLRHAVCPRTFFVVSVAGLAFVAVVAELIKICLLIFCVVFESLPCIHKMFPKTIVGASLVDRSPPRAGVAYDAVILRGESEAESSYVLRVGQEVVVSSDDPDEPFIARIGKLIFTPGDEPPWAFTCRWYYKIKEVADDNVRKNLAKVGFIIVAYSSIRILSDSYCFPSQHPKNVVFISRCAL